MYPGLSFYKASSQLEVQLKLFRHQLTQLHNYHPLRQNLHLPNQQGHLLLQISSEKIQKSTWETIKALFVSMENILFCNENHFPWKIILQRHILLFLFPNGWLNIITPLWICKRVSFLFCHLTIRRDWIRSHKCQMVSTLDTLSGLAQFNKND